ncbi:hypothetical protein NH8B_1866 [Pseudogulbenkiania sp. NH8B]|uniref:hypothetical protein n=1 Tax=Pseudogulbenkiania sp. (strain NH8B) TaxID=748280 RepID=UPI0002279EEB|nr:hypothetical protein [Pseudogulbenkiania sp. NH8B]BAK76682.1 hypothetical protein NH8B_1866 [Pseudogulbenkiania sp. NH8B]
MYTSILEQGDLFAPEQLDLFHEESLRSPEGFALSGSPTLAERPDHPADFTEAPADIAAT